MASVSDITVTGEFYGDGSRCIWTSSVGTSLQDPKGRCYKVACLSATNIQITIGTENFICNTPGDTINVSTTYTGTF